MRNIMNITTCGEDLLRFHSRRDLEDFYRSFGLDGLEVMEAGHDARGLVTPDNTIGVHLRYYNAWMDFWLQDEARLREEYGDWETCRGVFGGDTPQCLVEAFRANLRFAAPLKPEYLVFHVADMPMAETLPRRFHYTDEQVADAVIDLINQLADDIPGDAWLLLENLWYPGLTMERPEIVRRLLDGIRYRKTGVMLDVGHLMHTNWSLRSIEEAVDHIHSILDRYDDLSFIRGIHLHQSLTGEYARHCMQTWQPIQGSYQQRQWEVMGHIFRIDTHRPFQSPRIREIIQRTSPDYLVWEQISVDREEHSRYLAEQAAVLGIPSKQL